MFSQEQVMGFIRHALTLAGGVLVTKGVVDETQVLEAVGAIITLIGFAWSFRNKAEKKSIDNK